ncbi:MAG: hypothetical protein Q8Q36_03085 [bacterium]|nr:hypothetical protein [bacterium]
MEQEGQGKGALIGIIIVIVLLALGGYWLWREGGSSILSPETASDDLEAIEADLSANALNGFDDDLSDIEAELQ